MWEENKDPAKETETSPSRLGEKKQRYDSPRSQVNKEKKVITMLTTADSN